MANLSQIQQFREYANKIVGYWYNFTSDELLIFSLQEVVARQTKLIVTTDIFQRSTTYCIDIYPDGMCHLEMKNRDINRKYVIEYLGSKEMILKDEDGRLIMYERKIDYNFAEEALKKIK